MQNMDPFDRALIGDFQRNFPLISQPFAAIAQQIGLPQHEVLARLRALQDRGQVARVGATVRPNTAGASTLAAVAAPEDRIEDIAKAISEHDGINHSYLRENHWNIWFVATAPNAELLQVILDDIAGCTGLRVLDLRLVRPFNIDLGFALDGPRGAMGLTRNADISVLQDADRPILQSLSQGMPLTPFPFQAIADDLGRSEADIQNRITLLLAAGILTRLGVIVRHRAIGWTSNAMVVWKLPEPQIEAAGRALVSLAGVSLCYQRQTVPGIWDYPLYCMIHAKSRPEALAVLAQAAALPELRKAQHIPLFSTRCFKQTGAQLDHGKAA